MPTPLRTSALTLPGDTRRYVPSGRSLKVPLWTPLEKGQLFEAKIEVPLRLCWAQPHTNQKHEFDNLIRENLKTWVDWREQGGWRISGFPQVRGPYDVPTKDEKTEGPTDIKWYFASARFVRITPAYVPLDDFLHERDKAALYGVDLEADRPPYNDCDAEEPEDSPFADSGWVSPMKWAEEHRQKLGLKREDFLLGDIADPMEKPQSPAGISGRVNA